MNVSLGKSYVIRWPKDVPDIERYAYKVLDLSISNVSDTTAPQQMA